MNDTSEFIQKKYETRLMQLKAVKRLYMGCSMFDTSKQIVKSSIINNDHKISLSDVKKAIFLRFYGQDINLDQRQKILKTF